MIARITTTILQHYRDTTFIFNVLFLVLFPYCVYAKDNVASSIKWKYDIGPIWDPDPSHEYHGQESITTGIVRCSAVPIRSFSGVMPNNGTLSFSWMKKWECQFSFYRDNSIFPELSCNDYDNLNLFKNYSVKRGELITWRFSLESPPCSQGQCWLIINYYIEDGPTPPVPENKTNISSVKVDAITPRHICKGKNFHAYIIVNTPIDIYGVSNLRLECSKGLNIVNCLGMDGFFFGLEPNGSNNSYESNVSIPKKFGKFDIIYSVSSETKDNEFFINLSNFELITMGNVIPVNPKSIPIEIPNNFSEKFAEEYEHTYPDHKENIDCLWDCTIDCIE